MTAPKDPLGGLGRSLDSETAAVRKRFSDADRVTAAHVHSPRQTRTGGTVRDTFSFPRSDHRLIAALQQRCYAGGFSAAKSELVRAGLHALADMSAPAFAAALEAVEKLKPGPTPRSPAKPSE